MKLASAFREIGTIDTSLALAFADRISSDDWQENDYRKAMVGHIGEYDSLLLRHSPEYSNDTVRNMALFSKFEDVLSPIIERMRVFYRVDDYVAFCANLKPGGHVHMHRDAGDFLEGIHRVHIPIETNERALYIFEDCQQHFSVGNMYEIDNTRLHGAINKGISDRVHLIVNIYGELL